MIMFPIHRGFEKCKKQVALAVELGIFACLNSGSGYVYCKSLDRLNAAFFSILGRTTK